MRKIDIAFSDEIARVAPGLKVIVLSADVVNAPTDPALVDELNALVDVVYIYV